MDSKKETSQISVIDKEIKEIDDKSYGVLCFFTTLVAWKSWYTLLWLLLTSILARYFAILVKQNSNTIFSLSNSKEKYFNLMFPKAYIKLGEFSKESNRLLPWKLLGFLGISYALQNLMDFVSSLFNRKLSKISKETISSNSLINYFSSDEEKEKQIEKIEKFSSMNINAFLGLILSFFNVIFELWFFVSSILERSTETIHIVNYSILFFVLLVLYNLFTYYTDDFFISNFPFYRENISHKGFLKDFDGEKKDFLSTFQPSFTPLYYFTFLVFFCRDRENRYLANLPVDVYLFSISLVGVSRKLIKFWDTLNVSKIYYNFHKKKTGNAIEYLRRHTQEAEGVSFEN